MLLLFGFFVILYQIASTKLQSSAYEEAIRKSKICIAGSCKIPQQPANGQYVIGNDGSGRYKAQDCAFNYSVLILKCDRSYSSKPPQTNSSYCINGKWSPIPSTCSRTCASLYSSKSTSIECSFNDTILETCKNPIDGTVAKFNCEAFYEDPSIDLNPYRLCRNGEWNGIPQCVPICGQKRPIGLPNIIHGTNVAMGSYPWHVAIYNSKKEYQCGGAIISEWLVISAAHCFTKQGDGKALEEIFFIGAGKYYREYNDVRDESAQYSSINLIHLPSQYRGQALNYVADIVVLVLATPLVLSMSVQPVCMDWTNKLEHEQLVSNNFGEVSGFGYTQKGTNLADHLHELTIPFVPFDECYDKVPKTFKRYLHQDKICAGYLNMGKAVCGGDSGGALVFCTKYNERCYIRGVTSISPATDEMVCDPNQYGLYTLVSKHLDFIRPLYFINGTSQTRVAVDTRNRFSTVEKSNLQNIVKLTSSFSFFVGKTVGNSYCQPLKGCECFVKNGNFSFYNCTRNPHFTLQFLNGKLVEINCLEETFNWEDESDIPNLNCGDVEILTLNNCPLPINFANFLKRVGIISSKIVNISSFSKEPIKMKRRSIPNVLFDNLKNLKEIYVQNYSLVDLPPNLFHGSTHIEIISFAKNKIVNLPNNLFKDLINLTNLDLSFNKLQKLTFGCFRSLIQLKILNLQHNRLSDLNRKPFIKLYQLEKLYLNDNLLTNISYTVFENLYSLKEIYLANNFLIFLYMADVDNFNYVPFETNLELEIIDLRNNSINLLPRSLIKNKIKLKSLDLSYNFIGSLSVETLITSSGVPKTVNLEHNNISVVFFQLPNLEQESNDRNWNYASTTILLNNNPMDCTCDVYNLTSYLNETINPLVPTLFTIEANNLLCASPSSLVGVRVKDLLTRSVTCSYNDFGIEICPKECHCEIRLSDSTLIVDCSSKNLTTIPKLGDFPERFYKNYEVHLQNNSLTSAPVENMGYERVTTLIMSSNKINQLTWIPEKIKMLMIDNNKINYLSEELISKLEYCPLENLTLGHNPWMCDCSTIELSTFLISHLSTIKIDVNRIKCRDETILINYKIYDLCPIAPLYVYVQSTVGLILLIGFIIGVVLCHRKDNKVLKWIVQHIDFVHFTSISLKKNNINSRVRVIEVEIKYSTLPVKCYPEIVNL